MRNSNRRGIFVHFGPSTFRQLAFAVGVAAVLAGCGKKDDDEDDTPRSGGTGGVTATGGQRTGGTTSTGGSTATGGRTTGGGGTATGGVGEGGEGGEGGAQRRLWEARREGCHGRSSRSAAAGAVPPPRRGAYPARAYLASSRRLSSTCSTASLPMVMQSRNSSPWAKRMQSSRWATRRPSP